MKIAIITDDEQTISQHFGRALYYLVVTVENGQVLSQERRDKAGHHTFAPHGTTEHHTPGLHGFDPASQNRHAQMLAAIQDCQVLLAGGMGMGAQRSLEEAGIRPVLTDTRDIQAAVQAFLGGRLTERPDLAH